MILRLPLLTASLLTASLGLSNAHAQTTPSPEFQTCLSRLQPGALAAGVRDASYERLTQGLVPDMSVIEKLDFQPEFRTAIWDYLKIGRAHV